MKQPSIVWLKKAAELEGDADIHAGPKVADDRYQFQPWHVKLWRRRWYLLIPLYAYQGRKWVPKGAVWETAIGLAQVEMKWYSTLAEARARLDP